MGRNAKQGLDYFPLDTDFFQDTKIRLITVKYGVKAQAVILRLYCEIYRDKGYFIKWDEDTSLLFASEYKDVTANLIGSIVAESVKRGIFSEAIFNQFNSLTSVRLQETYIKICKDAKRINYEIDPRLCLLGISPGNTPEEMPNTPEFSTQRKGKETKEDKTKGKETKEEDVSCGKPPDFISQIIQIFADEFERTREISYFSNGVDRKAVGTLLQNYKTASGKDKTAEQTLQDFRTFFSQCCEIQDKWHWDKMTLPHINSQFNQLRILTNGKQHKPNNTKQPGVVDTGKEWIV